ncbi:MAG: hypothetical protein HY606_07945 [Planctomycetes bacterium]|nr:hypothetical protein [Planctomycetota bacterium]
MLIAVLVDETGKKVKCSSIDALLTDKLSNQEIQDMSKKFVFTVITSKSAASSLGVTKSFVVADGYNDVIATSSLDNPGEAISKANNIYTDRSPSWSEDINNTLKENEKTENSKLIVCAFTSEETKTSDKTLVTLANRVLWKARSSERVIWVKENFNKESVQAKQFGITNDGEVALIRVLEDGTSKLVKKFSSRTKASEIRKSIFGTLAQIDKEAKEKKNNKKEEGLETASAK